MSVFHLCEVVIEIETCPHFHMQTSLSSNNRIDTGEFMALETLIDDIQKGIVDIASTWGPLRTIE